MIQRYLTFPFHIATDGRIANSKIDSHIKELIEQVLFTNPGERVNLPEFGCGLLNIVFEGNNEYLASQVKFLVTQALNRWLGEIISVDSVLAERYEAELKIEVVYTRKDTLTQDTVTLTQ